MFGPFISMETSIMLGDDPMHRIKVPVIARAALFVSREPSMILLPSRHTALIADCIEYAKEIDPRIEITMESVVRDFEEQKGGVSNFLLNSPDPESTLFGQLQRDPTHLRLYSAEEVYQVADGYAAKRSMPILKKVYIICSRYTLEFKLGYPDSVTFDPPLEHQIKGVIRVWLAENIPEIKIKPNGLIANGELAFEMTPERPHRGDVMQRGATVTPYLKNPDNSWNEALTSKAAQMLVNAMLNGKLKLTAHTSDEDREGPDKTGPDISMMPVLVSYPSCLSTNNWMFQEIYANQINR